MWCHQRWVSNKQCKLMAFVQHMFWWDIWWWNEGSCHVWWNDVWVMSATHGRKFLLPSKLNSFFHYVSMQHNIFTLSELRSHVLIPRKCKTTCFCSHWAIYRKSSSRPGFVRTFHNNFFALISQALSFLSIIVYWWCTFGKFRNVVSS